MEKKNRIAAPLGTAICTILALSGLMMAASPARAAEPSIGPQTGAGTTSLTMIAENNGIYGGTAEEPYLDEDGNPTDEDTGRPNPSYNPDDDHDGLGDNIAFTVPSSINFVLSADGTLTGPTNAYIENRSVMPIHAEELKVKPSTGWNLVEDASSSQEENSVELQMKPVDGTFEQLGAFTTRSQLHNRAEWNMSGTDAVIGSGADVVTLDFAGKVSHLSADVTQQRNFGEIHWYMQAGRISAQRMNVKINDADPAEFTLETSGLISDSLRNSSVMSAIPAGHNTILGITIYNPEASLRYSPLTGGFTDPDQWAFRADNLTWEEVETRLDGILGENWSFDNLAIWITSAPTAQVTMIVNDGEPAEYTLVTSGNMAGSVLQASPADFTNGVGQVLVYNPKASLEKNSLGQFTDANQWAFSAYHLTWEDVSSRLDEILGENWSYDDIAIYAKRVVTL